MEELRRPWRGWRQGSRRVGFDEGQGSGWGSGAVVGWGSGWVHGCLEGVVDPCIDVLPRRVELLAPQRPQLVPVRHRPVRRGDRPRHQDPALREDLAPGDLRGPGRGGGGKRDVEGWRPCGWPRVRHGAVPKCVGRAGLEVLCDGELEHLWGELPYTVPSAHVAHGLRSGRTSVEPAPGGATLHAVPCHRAPESRRGRHPEPEGADLGLGLGLGLGSIKVRGS